MSNQNKLSYLFYTIFGFLIAAIVSTIISSSIFDMQLRSLSRPPNIRMVPDYARLSFLTRFNELKLNSHSKEKKLILFGDSQAYGVHEYDEYIFSVMLNKNLPNLFLYDFSMIDGRVSDQILILNEFIKKNKRVDTVIINSNLAHLPDMNNPGKLATKNPLPYLFVVANIFNLNWYNDIKPSPDNMRINEINAEFNNYKLNKDRFAASQKDISLLKTNVIELISVSKKISNHVIFYITPIAWSKLIEDESDPVIAKNEFKIIMSACINDSQVTCLDLRKEFTEKDFQDMVHFNRSGHIKMAKILTNTVKTINAA